ncbi:MAG: pilus assembly PilX family protein [Burkholderiales bacterium]
MSRANTIGARASLPSRVRGAVLFIALIVLVAMTLAGIAIMRSVDTATLIAGNLAFKQGTVQSSDNGIEQAYQWLLANRPALSLDNAAQGYNSGYGTPVWTNAATWASAVTVGTDAAGNTIAYQIHRMCNCANTLYNGICAAGQSNQCALDNPTGTGAPPPPAAGDSFTVGAPGFLQDPRVYYRITVRTQGPRNTVSYVQSMVAVAL